MRLRTRPLVARGAALLVLLVYVAGISANGWLERRLGLQSEHPAEDVVLFVGFSLFAAVGALLVAKRPDNPIGWIMSANALIVGIFPACESYAAYVMSTSGHPDALAVFGVWANSWYWYLLLRSEEHTSELQSHSDLVCRLLLEKKKKHAKEPRVLNKPATCQKTNP